MLIDSSEPIIIYIKLGFFSQYALLQMLLLYAQLLAVVRGFYSVSQSRLITYNNLELANISQLILFF